MELLSARAPWYLAGPLIGLVVVALLWVSNWPLGASAGWIDLIAWARRPRRGPRRTVLFLAGVAVGGLVAALASGRLHPGGGYGLFDARYGTTPATRALLLALSGAVMGYGARTAGGCTSGHGICGTSLGSRASWVSTVVFMATAIASANLLALLLGSRT